MYRVIDFVLTNLSESGVPVVGILSQYRPSSLMDHVGIGRPGTTTAARAKLNFLPPYQGTRDVDWYRGTADAIHQNLHVIRRWKARDVLVVSGDHAYRMDYRPLVGFHRRSRADLTMVFKRLDCGRPSRFGIGCWAKAGGSRRTSRSPRTRPATWPPDDLRLQDRGAGPAAGGERRDRHDLPAL